MCLVQVSAQVLALAIILRELEYSLGYPKRWLSNSSFEDGVLATLHTEDTVLRLK